MKFKKMPSQEYLKSILDYNPDTGEFTPEEAHEAYFNAAIFLYGEFAKAG